jgi:adenylate cyclase
MPPSGTEYRRLAAIMFTDMVGYSTLAQRNEALALELLEEHQQALRAQFRLFEGREVKSTGDGFLVEFPSALQATQCALEIQRTLAARNPAAPAERQIEVRIGLHVGDVVHREGDIFGDGVNIAARIEPLAASGGICLSDTVYAQVRNKLSLRLTKLDSPQLKHIEIPLDVYRVELPWQPQTTGGPKTAPRSRPKSRATNAAAWVLAALILGGSGWFGYQRLSRRPTPDGTSLARQAEFGGARTNKSIAVLPFENFSAERDTEYLSDGITEEITTALSRVTGLKVAARGSAFTFKGRREDVRKVSEALHVTTVLEGSVRKDGNQIRITAQLISADGFHLWATNYDRTMENLLAMQTEIAQQIADKLQLELSGADQRQLARLPTESAEAHELYLKGLYWWNKRNKPSLEKAVQFFRQALDKDTSYARAHAGLAFCYAVMPEYLGSPPKELNARARASARRALELDDSLAEAHAALGASRQFEYDWAGAEADFKHAIQQNPNYPTAHQWYGILLRDNGRFAEAMTEFQRAHELDPLSLILLAAMASCYHVQGQDDRAIEECRKGLELDPGFGTLHEVLGQAYLKQGMLAEALAEFEKVRESAENSPYALGLLGYTYARLGKQAEARGILTRLDEVARGGFTVQREKARVYFGLGERDRVFECLEKARLDYEIFSELNVLPLWAELREDPRCTELLRKMNLRK